jgi:putative SOS response-associated peptidase YedK
MCYDISLTTTVEIVTQYLPGIQKTKQLELELDPEAHLHVLAQSFRKYPIIVEEEGAYKLELFEWGVIGDYMNTPDKVKQFRSSMCNARSEKIVDDRKSYWHRIRRQRCLIPVTGIFEHREIKGWKNKVPYFVRLKDRELFCIPGLYNYSPIPDVETGELKGTFTLITRAANTVMSQIHNCGENAFRMPLFLEKEAELLWLKPTLTDAEIAGILGFEMPSEALDYHPVYTIRTTKARPDEKPKTEPFDWPGLPALGKTEEPGKQTALF